MKQICDNCKNYDEDEDKCLKYDHDVGLTVEECFESKTGHWIDTTKVIGFPRVECSVCGSGAGASWMVYCPMCGSKNIT